MLKQPAGVRADIENQRWGRAWEGQGRRRRGSRERDKSKGLGGGVLVLLLMGLAGGQRGTRRSGGKGGARSATEKPWDCVGAKHGRGNSSQIPHASSEGLRAWAVRWGGGRGQGGGAATKGEQRGPCPCTPAHACRQRTVGVGQVERQQGKMQGRQIKGDAQSHQGGSTSTYASMK